jgi:NADH dehydrogenase
MDRLVTLFGGGGFLGRYVAQELLRTGVRVRVAERDPSRAFFLKPLGGLGQTQFVVADITRAASVARAIEGADAVINLIGILKGDFQALHVAGAHTVAEAAARAGASALVQVSAIGADPLSESAYGRSKGAGDQAVRAAFPRATILRPSILFGAEDAFVNRFAGMIAALPIVPVIRPGVKLQPAWVADVARATALAALDPERFGGETYELGGPEALTMAELNRWIAGAIGAKTHLPEVPDPIARLMAKLTGWAPGAPMTWNQWLMLQHDNIVSPGAVGFEAFGIVPKPLAAVAPAWLVRYRREGRFSLDKPAQA